MRVGPSGCSRMVRPASAGSRRAGRERTIRTVRAGRRPPACAMFSSLHPGGAAARLSPSGEVPFPRSFSRQSAVIQDRPAAGIEEEEHLLVSRKSIYSTHLLSRDHKGRGILPAVRKDRTTWESLSESYSS